MTDITAATRPAASVAPRRSLYAHDALHGRRMAAERRFKAYGIAAILVGLLFLAVLFWSILSQGLPAFRQTVIDLPVDFVAEEIDPQGLRSREAVLTAPLSTWDRLLQRPLYAALGADPTADEMRAARAWQLVSRGARIQLRDMVAADPSLIGTTQTVRVIADGNVDAFLKGTISAETPEDRRQIKNDQIAMIDQLREDGLMTKAFNWGLFNFSASSRPETAGLYAALVGSAYMMTIVLAVALPLGVAASIYLEEFAPKNRFTDLVEVNINNLAAVPSIVFGILGLALFINTFGLPRSAPLVGGLVLSLMTLPTIIISTRAALKAVPPSIREAALGVGASKMQSVFHHVLPLAAPGILTGTIIGLAQALGETAPLLLIGMVAFIASPPGTPLDPATALPVQIYMWSNSAERAFVERTSAAIIVLLVFMLAMNLIAIILRRRFERRW